jgi:PAS domain S-box-containing protein
MIDFRVLFESAPGCNLILTPDLSIAAVSDEYLRVTLTRREEVIGRQLFDVFPEGPNDREGGGPLGTCEAIRRVLAEKRRQVLPVQRHPSGRPGWQGYDFEERYWSHAYAPVLDDQGRVTHVMHHVEDVTDLVRMRKEKVENEKVLHEAAIRSARYAQLLDTAPDAIVIVDHTGRIQLINHRAEELFGHDRAALIGEPLEVLIPERSRSIHVAHIGRYFARPGVRPMGSGLQLFGRRKDGSEVPIEVSLSPHDSEHGTSVSAAIRDISERKRLMEAAKVTADRLTSAVDSIQDALALFDSNDRLILCNGAYRALIGDTLPGPLVGMSYEELLDAWLGSIDLPDEAARARFREERLERRASPMASFDIRLRDGRKLRVTDRRTREGGIVKTIWDLTEDERRAAELREARATAEAASAAKSEFLSSMSHELRTPLNAVLGFAQLLQRDQKEPLSERHKARVRQILAGGEHLLRLIDDVLNLARIEGGSVSVILERVNVLEVLEDVRKTLEPMANSHGILLTLDELPHDLPPVAADPTRFAQILLNFGSNAIKYNRRDGRVGFSVLRPTPTQLRVVARDTGLGIPLDRQHTIFQPFQRAGQETGPIEGTGIGLVISQRLAQLMGGDVGFDSTPGVGSVFWVDIPFYSNDAERGGARADGVPPSAGNTLLGKRRILYVEDNAANVSFMRDLVGTFENTELFSVSTAEVWIETARMQRPDVILMDINLPGMNGIDALNALRKISETKPIPVIALTAAATERDRQRGIEAGFYRYLTKPVNVDDLILALESLAGFQGSAER